MADPSQQESGRERDLSTKSSENNAPGDSMKKTPGERLRKGRDTMRGGIRVNFNEESKQKSVSCSDEGLSTKYL